MSLPILVTMGEPAGIGPDVCLALAQKAWPVVIMGSLTVLAERAAMLGVQVTFLEYVADVPCVPKKNQLMVLDYPEPSPVEAGILNIHHASYVMKLLHEAVQRCLTGEFQALVTAPVHKGILNDAGYHFTGHTELLAELTGADEVVMLLVSDDMRMGLVTTHLPLKEVSKAITPQRLEKTIRILHHALQADFSISSPHIAVAGLNPHAGESGHLGREEIEVVMPVLARLREEGLKLSGPMPADTLFTHRVMKPFDALLAMYHDQGLPVLKYASFGRAVNITLGLPMIRTSVDHGTALELAGTGQADAGSLLAAVKQAQIMVAYRARGSDVAC